MARTDVAASARCVDCGAPIERRRRRDRIRCPVCAAARALRVAAEAASGGDKPAAARRYRAKLKALGVTRLRDRRPAPAPG